MSSRAVYFLLACLSTSLFAASFAFADTSPKFADGDPFVSLVNEAMNDLRDLCAIGANHPYCGNENAQPIADSFEITMSENKLQSTIARLSANVFEVQDRANPRSAQLFPVLTPAERNTYLAKMQYLNQLSDTQNILQHQLLALVVLQLTVEWVDIYGDPFRETNIHVVEAGHVLPMRADATHLIEEREAAASNLAGYTAVGVFVIRMARAPFVANLLRGVNFLNIGLSSRLPIGAIAQLAMAAAPVVAAAKPQLVVGRDGDRKYLNTNDILPSPAHLITFGFNTDLNMIGQDVQKQWQTNERELYEGAVSSGAKWGALLFVGYLGSTTSSRIAAYLTTKGLTQTAKVAKTVLSPVTFENVKYLRYAKYLEISPASLVAGVAIGAVVDESIFMFRLSKLARSLRGAAEANDKTALYNTLGEIIRLYVKSTEFVEQTIDTEKAFIDYAMMDGASGPFDQLVSKRSQFASHLDPINFPASTGATVLKQTLCDANQIAPRSTRDVFTDKQTQMALIYVNTLRSSLTGFKSSADDLTAWFNTEIPYLRRKNLTDAAQMLQNYDNKFLALNTRVQTLLNKYPAPYLEEHGVDPDSMQPADDSIWHGLDLTRAALRNIEDVEWHHKKDFSSIDQTYFCKVKDDDQ